METPKRKHTWRISPEEVTEYHQRAGSAPNLSREEVSELRRRACAVRWAKPGARERHREAMATRPKVPKAPLLRDVDPEAYRKKQSEASKSGWAKRDHSEASRRTKARWEDPEYRERMLTMTRSPESRERNRQAAIAQWAAKTPEAKLTEMQRLHSTFKGGHKLSALEASVAMVLNELKLWYRFHDAIGPYVMDIHVMGTPEIDIECDGIYWHGPDQSDRDNARDIWFAENGYNVIRVTDATLVDLKAKFT